MAFFEGWLRRQQIFLEKLQEVDMKEEEDEKSRSLIEEVLVHYQQYYAEKKKSAIGDVFLFSPPWFSSYEITLFWVSGFKPSFIFQLVNGAVGQDLAQKQMEMIEMVKDETRVKEMEIEKELALVQESVGVPPLYNLVRRMERLVDGEVSEFDAATEELQQAMVAVMGLADGLRASTVMKVVEILSPWQTVKVMVGIAEFHLQTRRWGLERDASIERTRGTDIDFESSVG